MSDKEIFKYAGKDVDVHWNGKLCIHIGECGRAKGELFINGRQPWCQPDLASNEEVEAVVQRCPTGALTYQHKDAYKDVGGRVESGTETEGSNTEQAATENTIHVAYNGPLYFKGDLDIEGAPEDLSAVEFRAALCRCGQSKNKPFCDNSNEGAGFKDYGAVGEAGEGLESTGGKLNITLRPDGPLIVKGNVTITSANGRRAWQGKATALCRCGASQNKPFCDGKHKETGFKS
jgi:CDGSH-type Zn-finger protein/uncharacterized Fe-S cluster protein YjdI